MSTFTIHTKDSAPADAADGIATAEQKFGFLPNLIGGLAEAPITVDAYYVLMDALSRASLTPTELNVAWLEINRYHECKYCMEG